MKQRKVLVVDDNPDAVLIVRSTLESHGYAVSAADSARTALELVESDPPDVVLLDVMMPDMSGIEMLEILKSSPRTGAIPVILLTAKSQDEDLLTGYQVGADYYITKPFTARQLLYGVQLVLGEERPS
ncbi:MAG: hypothetical protein KatS3mg076_1154 [Candidatus Binatia bacterium]|nr:MAG: hypothetical protein KatS3mg076_1154 [Candidatus Binatia bacterium]